MNEQSKIVCEGMHLMQDEDSGWVWQVDEELDGSVFSSDFDLTWLRWQSQRVDLWPQ